MKLSLAQTKTNETSIKHGYNIYLILFGIGLFLRVVTALFLHQPGYVDAYYYYAIAANFHNGQGLVENSLWNYQVDSFTPNSTPLHLVHPAFGYWLPLASWLVILSFAIFGISFWAAQLPFILLAATLPPLAFWLGQLAFGTNQRRYSWAMAVVMLFPGRYFLFLNAPDNFAPFAVIILLGLICIYKALWQAQPRLLIVAGGLSGLAYLSRSDGILLLLTLVVCFVWQRRQKLQSQPLAWKYLGGALLLGLLVVIPWLWRNLNVFGAILPATSSKVLFLRDYNELFSYKLPLDFNYYVNLDLPASNWGIGPLLVTKLNAVWLDLLILAVQGLFLFGPLFLVGLLLLKGRTITYSYLPFGVYFVFFYSAMVLVFTLAGEHGTIFHSVGGLLPFQTGAAVACIDALAEWYARRRKRVKVVQARRLILGLFLFFNVALTLYVAYTGLQGWDDDYRYSQQVGAWFKQNNLDSNVIIVGEPLSYSYATGQTAIPLASDGLAANVAAAQKYGATWLALGRVHYAALDGLYEQKKGLGVNWVTTLTNGTQIYQIKPDNS